MTDLESLTPAMFATVNEVLGERITYIPNGSAPIYPKAHVYYGDEQQDIGAGQSIEQDITVHIPKLSIPAMPNSSDRIRLSKRPGATFRPVNPATDDSGTDWIVKLKIVR